MEIKGFEDKKALSVRRWSDNDEVFSLFNFSDDILKNRTNVFLKGDGKKLLESSSETVGRKRRPCRG